uniref:Uncharacterized protein n=1 Tax=Anas platyrhynchos platyrhynchos TaxID=8840 RepID=A0A493THD7_ANAPP
MSNLGYEEDGSDITELAAVRNWACNFLLGMCIFFRIGWLLFWKKTPP